MKLSECMIGRVVAYSDNLGEKKYIGHIIGLTINCTDEVIPVINWTNPEKGWDNPAPIHHNNISIYED